MSGGGGLFECQYAWLPQHGWGNRETLEVGWGGRLGKIEEHIPAFPAMRHYDA